MRDLLRPAAFVVLAYFLVLAGLVAVTEVWDLRLWSGMMFFAGPTPWHQFVLIFIYAAPFVIALVFAVPRRPAWRAFLAVVVPIFLVHGAFGALAAQLRAAYLTEWREDERLAKAAKLTPGTFTHEELDGTGDGLVDSIVISGDLKAENLPPGHYQAWGGLFQGTPPTIADSFPLHEVILAEMMNGPVALRFEADPQHLREASSRGPLTLDIELQKWRKPDLKGQLILSLCGWAAFFCPTPRGGGDRDIHSDQIDLARFAGVYGFSLDPAGIQREQLVFRRFVGDFGRDLDGDGLFDELVIQLEVDSIWQGELYFQARLNGYQGPSINHETQVSQGISTVELVIDGSQLKSIGLDGPYTIKRPLVFNNTPYCPGGKCENKNRPMFTVYVSDYTTGPYAAEAFE
jgi:hypothetical protein